MTCISALSFISSDPNRRDYRSPLLGPNPFSKRISARKALKKALAIIEDRPEESSSDEEIDEVNHNNEGNSKGDHSNETNDDEEEKQGG